MATYEVWASNDVHEWTQCLFETESRDEAFKKAQEIYELKKFRFLAIDRNGETIWPDDPDTPLDTSGLDTP